MYAACMFGVRRFFAAISRKAAYSSSLSRIVISGIRRRSFLSFFALNLHDATRVLGKPFHEMFGFHIGRREQRDPPTHDHTTEQRAVHRAGILRLISYELI